MVGGERGVGAVRAVGAVSAVGAVGAVGAVRAVGAVGAVGGGWWRAWSCRGSNRTLCISWRRGRHVGGGGGGCGGNVVVGGERGEGAESSKTRTSPA